MRMTTWAALSILVGAAAAWAGGLEEATRTLCDHIKGANRKVLVAKAGAETVWSDAAVFERAARFPPALAALLAHPSGEIPSATMIYFAGAEAKRDEWRAAQLRRTGAGDFSCDITDGKIVALVDCRYVAYLQARYPRAELRVKAPFEPVLLFDGGRLVAMLMPMKR